MDHFNEHIQPLVDELADLMLPSQLDARINAIHAMMRKPGSEPLTSPQMRARANQRRDIATTMKLGGRRVVEDYK